MQIILWTNISEYAKFKKKKHAMYWDNNLIWFISLH